MIQTTQNHQDTENFQTQVTICGIGATFRVTIEKDELWPTLDEKEYSVPHMEAFRKRDDLWLFLFRVYHISSQQKRCVHVFCLRSTTISH